MVGLTHSWNLVRCHLHDGGFVEVLGAEGENPAIEGSTMFFRNVSLQEKLVKNIFANTDPDEEISILIAPGSVGCEALSYAMIAHQIDPTRKVRVESFDIADVYTDLASSKTYPKIFADSIKEQYRHYIQPVEGEYFTFPEAINSMVSVLPSMNIMNFETDKKYHLVSSMNLLMHLNREDVPVVMEKLSGLSKGLFSFNNFDEISLSASQYKDLGNSLSHSFNLLNGYLSPLEESVSLPPYLSYQALKDYDEGDYAWNLGDNLDYTLVLGHV